MNPWSRAMLHLGVPFRHRGRSPATDDYRGALDCLGLVVLVAIADGIAVFDEKAYGREAWNNGIQAGLRAHCGAPHAPSEMVANDLPLFQMNPGEDPSHVGICAPHPYGLGLVHTYAAIGMVVFHRLDERWLEKIVEVYSWPDKR